MKIKFAAICLSLFLLCVLAACGSTDMQKNSVNGIQPDVVVVNKDNFDVNVTVEPTEADRVESNEGYTGVNFPVYDIDGNAVNLEEIFTRNHVTVLNLWATWCQPCLSEMPELNRLNKDILLKGSQVIGIVLDATTPDVIDEAKSLLEEMGIDYLILLPTPEIDKYFNYDYIPATYFIDNEGYIIDSPIVGVNVQELWDRLEHYLSHYNQHLNVSGG